MLTNPVMQEVNPSDITKDSVLHRIIRDEAIIVRLIKQDLITSLILQKTWSQDMALIGTNELELNKITFELMSLDRYSNTEEVILFYDKYIEDSCKMLAEFPTLSKEEIANNCYHEVKKKCKW